MPSHAATAKGVTACKRLPPYVRRPIRSENIAVIDIGRFLAYRNRALRPRGGVVTQRTANPRTPVQFRAWPPILKVPAVVTTAFLERTYAKPAGLKKNLEDPRQDWRVLLWRALPGFLHGIPR
jgi:hypothetical protein